eukprot:9835152-Alexandrium_andersonii.AAC.1
MRAPSWRRPSTSPPQAPPRALGRSPRGRWVRPLLARASSSSTGRGAARPSSTAWGAAVGPPFASRRISALRRSPRRRTTTRSASVAGRRRMRRERGTAASARTATRRTRPPR